MLKLKAAILYLLFLLSVIGIAASVVVMYFLTVSNGWRDSAMFFLMWMVFVLLVGMFALAMRPQAVHAWRAAQIQVGDVTNLGSNWHWSNREKRYVPYQYLTVTVKNPDGVTRTDGKTFKFGETGVVPMGSAVYAIAFPDRKRVLVEYRSEREPMEANELPAGTWFTLTRYGFLDNMAWYLETQAKLRQEAEQKAAEEQKAQERADAEKSLILEALHK